MCHGEVTRYVTEGVTRPRPDPTHISITHCMTVTGGTGSPASCNATDSIEHLDYDHTPPCEADFEPPHPIGEAPAAWVMHATGCRHLLCTFALLCDDCKSWYVANPQDCSRCGAWFKLSWEPLR